MSQDEFREIAADLELVTVTLHGRNGKTYEIRLLTGDSSTLEDFQMTTDTEWVEADRFLDYEPPIPRMPTARRFTFAVTNRMHGASVARALGDMV